MKKLITVYLLVFAAAIVIYATAFAQSDSEPIVIIPYLSPSEIDIYSNQEVILGARWGACLNGLTRPIPSAAILDWKINDVPVFSSQKEVKPYWGAPTLEYRGGYPCIVGDGEYIWIRYWYYSIGMLSPGDYEIRLHYSLSHPMIDGGDLDGDRRPDIYEGSLADNTITVHVLVP